jgi:hypothetical protein
MRSAFSHSVSLFMILVFAGMGVLSTHGEAVVADSSSSLMITADGSSCAEMSTESACCSETNDGETPSRCSSDESQNCVHCTCLHSPNSISPYMVVGQGMDFIFEMQELTHLPDVRPTEAIPQPIEHIPILSIS